MNLTFRTIPEKRDIKRIREIVVSTKFFYDHEVDVAVELIEERLGKGESTGYHFVFAEVDGDNCSIFMLWSDSNDKIKFRSLLDSYG